MSIKRMCCFILLLSLGLLSVSARAGIIPLNLNDFYSDPTVSIATDGQSATLNEDPGFSFVLLSNDPGLGDPNIIIPAMNTFLQFDFVFSEAAAGIDQFVANLTDTAGNPLGMPFSLVHNASVSGTASFDLSTLIGQTLGLTFQLVSLPGDNDLAAVLNIRNLRLVTETVPAPEPPLMALFVFASLFCLRRKAKN